MLQMVQFGSFGHPNTDSSTNDGCGPGDSGAGAHGYDTDQ